MEVSGATYPEQYHGNAIHAPEGKSLVPIFETGDREGHEYMYWEHQNNCAVRRGDWKAIKKLSSPPWQLYNLENDRAETQDLAAQFPAIVADLDLHWQAWADSHLVLPKKIAKAVSKE